MLDYMSSFCNSEVTALAFALDQLSGEKIIFPHPIFMYTVLNIQRNIQREKNKVKH